MSSVEGGAFEKEKIRNKKDELRLYRNFVSIFTLRHQNIPLVGPNYEEKFREFFEGVEEARHPKNLTIFRGPGGKLGTRKIVKFCGP